MKKWPPFLLFGCLFFLKTTAQQPPVSTESLAWSNAPTERGFLFFEHLGKREGLPPGTVSCMAEDAAGFLWFAILGRGLFRFDGFNWREFTRENSSLPSHFINQLLDDGLGRLWIATNEGLAFIRLADLQLVAIKNSPTVKTLFQEKKTGRLLIGSEGRGILEWKNGPDTLRPLPIRRIENGWTTEFWAHELNFCYQLTADHDGKIWMLGGEFGLHTDRCTGLFQLDLEAGLARWFPTFETARTNGFFPLSEFSIGQKLHFQESSRQLFIIQEGGPIRQFQLEKKRWHNLSIPQNGQSFSLLDLFFLDEKNGWLLTMNGLKTVSFEQKKGFDQARFQETETAWQPPAKEISSALRMRNGLIWLGHSEGLSKLVPLHQQFAEKPLFEVDFPADCLLEWPETGELFGFRVAEKGRIEVISKPLNGGKMRRGSLAVPALRDLPNTNIRTVFRSKKGIVWLGLSRGMLRFDPRNFQFEWIDRPINTQNGKPARTSEFWVERFFEDRTGRLLIATWAAGLLETDGAEPLHFEQQSLDFRGSGQPLFNLSLNDVFEDSAGRLWLAYQGSGLAVFLPEKKRLLRLLDADGKQPLVGQFVFKILPGRDGRLWFLSLEGLSFWDEKPMADESDWTRFSAEMPIRQRINDGLSDAKNRLWLRSESGLIRFDPTTGNARIFDERDGLTADFSRRLPMWNAADGRILLGNRWQFQPDEIQTDGPPPQAIFSGFRINERAAPFADRLHEMTEIVLNPGDDLFTVEFAALEFAAPEAVHFAYKLDGFDREWVECGTRRFTSYSQLPGGSYLFRVRATNADGVQSSERVLKIRIIPPFYRTGWFAWLCAAVFVGAVWGIFRYREMQRIERERIRLRIARDLHDDVGSTLSSIQLLSEVAMHSPSKKAQAEQLQLIGERSREVLSNVSDLVWGINPQHDSLPHLIERMRNFAWETLNAVGIDLDFQVETAFSQASLSAEIRKEWYFIFKEAINNAAKYSRATTVSVCLSGDKKGLQMDIRDDGQGFKMAEPATKNPFSRGGNGLKNMQARATAMGADFSIRSAAGAGVEICLRLNA